MDNFNLKQFLTEGKLLKEETDSIGYSLESLPGKVKTKLLYVFDDTEDLNPIIQWVKQHISELEEGQTVFYLSNEYQSFNRMAMDLDINPEEIGEYIDSAIDEIGEENY